MLAGKSHNHWAVDEFNGFMHENADVFLAAARKLQDAEKDAERIRGLLADAAGALADASLALPEISSTRRAMLRKASWYRAAIAAEKGEQT